MPRGRAQPALRRGLFLCLRPLTTGSGQDILPGTERGTTEGGGGAGASWRTLSRPKRKPGVPLHHASRGPPPRAGEDRQRPLPTPKQASPSNRPFLHYPAVPAFIRLFHSVDKGGCGCGHGETHGVRSARRESRSEECNRLNFPELWNDDAVRVPGRSRNQTGMTKMEMAAPHPKAATTSFTKPD